MFTFFRRIRKGLLGSGATEKYVLYAIGEIVLVVIGILIALQINNWNNEVQANKFEVKLLGELQKTIIGDTASLSGVIVSDNNSIISCTTILYHFDQKLPYHDSLDMHFVKANNWSILIPRYSAFENSKSYGLHFIKNDITRSLLTELYEYSTSWINTMNERQTLYNYNTVIPLMTDLFNNTPTPYRYRKGIHPHDYEALKKNARYRTILETNMRNRGYEIQWMQKNQRIMKELVIKLQEEIESRTD